MPAASKTHDLLPPALAASPTFAPLLRFLEDIDKLPRHRDKHLNFTPRFDLLEFHGKYELYGDLPGVRREDLVVELKERDGVLVIKGKRILEHPRAGAEEVAVKVEGEEGEQEKKEKPVVAEEKDKGKEGTYVIGERGTGHFERRFRLTGKVRREGVIAGLDDGVLRVVVPKVEREEERGERIEIL